MISHLFTTWFTKNFRPTVENYCSETKIPFKTLPITDDAAGHPRLVRKMHNEINVAFMPTNTTSILQPMDQ